MTLSLALEVRREPFTLDLALEVPPGVTVLLGPSGAGKSTALAAAAGLLRPDRGAVRLGGETLFDASTGVDRPPRRRGLGYVPQDGLLFPHLDVRRNLLFGAGRSTAEPALDDVARAVDVQDLLERLPAALSGGERQRVALGRALLSAPRALLLDEPLAALDRPRRARLAAHVRDHARRAGLPVLLVTHALDEALALADRVVVLHAGRKVAEGPPLEVLAAPRDPLVARLSGFDTVLEVEVEGHDAEDGARRARWGGVRLLVPGPPAPAGARARYGLRARDVLLAAEPPRGLSARNVIAAVVREVAPREGVLEVRAEADDATARSSGAPAPAGVVVARVVPSAARELGLAPGKAVWLVIKTTALEPLDLE